MILEDLQDILKFAVFWLENEGKAELPVTRQRIVIFTDEQADLLADHLRRVINHLNYFREMAKATGYPLPPKVWERVLKVLENPPSKELQHKFMKWMIENDL